MKNNPLILTFVLIMLGNGYAQSYAQTKSFTHAADTTEVDVNGRESEESMSDSEYLSMNNTLQKYRHSPDFAYMQYLDSLLRKDTVRQKKTASGTIRKQQNEVSAINRILNGKPLRIFFWALAVLFIMLISYRLLSDNMFFRRSKGNIRDDTAEDHLQELAEVSEYDVLITEAEKVNSYNLAVRYLFLKTLKNLSDQEIISFTPDKTNSDYIREMKEGAVKEQFRSLAYNYEYLWYGKFSINDVAYRQLKNEFHLFSQKLFKG